ncbi:seipin-like [Hydractinia symbiolongicarpus]|uniref:seipin-like n=1 Tax=Hydractinia symbiolongicarpus TaxID=13093 RepID=UPI00254CA69F|nr:seipin-like [Hydractinia symbiolongicarpus]
MLPLIFNLLSALWKAYWFIVYAFVMSLVVFLCFYLFYLPTALHIKPVHFQYRADCGRNVDDALCSFPSAELILHDSSKAADDGIRVLTRGQAYDITLELEVPLSERNKQIGMFMVQIDLLDKSWHKIASSSRSTMLRYESNLLTTLSTLFHIFPLVLGIKEQKQTLVLPLLEDFMDDSYRPAMSARITIHSKYIQMYSAQIKITALFTGVRYYMYNWPITFNLMMFSSIFSIVTLICLWRTLNKETLKESERKEYGDLSESSDGEVEDILGGGQDDGRDTEKINASTRVRVRRRMQAKENEMRKNSDSSQSDTIAATID